MNENVVIVTLLLRNVNCVQCSIEHRVTNIEQMCIFCVALYISSCLFMFFFTKTLAVHDAEMCRVRYAFLCYFLLIFGAIHPNKQLCPSELTKVNR